MTLYAAFLDELTKIAAEAPVPQLSVEDAWRIHNEVLDQLEGYKLASADMDAYYRELFLEKVGWPWSKVVNVGGETVDFSPRSGLGYKDMGNKLKELGSMYRLPEGVSVADAAAAGNTKGVASRIAGEGLHSAGHHMEHASTTGKLLNPLGKPVGGMFEGLARGTGQELQRGVQSGVQHRVGGALIKHAPNIGRAGEVLGAAGTATALGTAVSPAAAGLAGVAKATGLYHPMHGALGSFGTNLVKDVAATGIEGAAAGSAAKGAFKSIASRLPGALLVAR